MLLASVSAEDTEVKRASLTERWHSRINVHCQMDMIMLTGEVSCSESEKSMKDKEEAQSHSRNLCM